MCFRNKMQQGRYVWDSDVYSKDQLMCLEVLNDQEKFRLSGDINNRTGDAFGGYKILSKL